MAIFFICQTSGKSQSAAPQDAYYSRYGDLAITSEDRRRAMLVKIAPLVAVVGGAVVYCVLMTLAKKKRLSSGTVDVGGKERGSSGRGPQMKTTCPKCGQESDVDESLAGLDLECKHCKTWYTVPAVKDPPGQRDANAGGAGDELTGKSESEEVVVADGMFLKGGHFFITVTDRRLIVIRLGTSFTLFVLLILLMALAVLGIRLAYFRRVEMVGLFPIELIQIFLGVLGFYLAWEFSMLPIRRRARKLSLLNAPARLSAFPNRTTVYALENVTLQKSVWTGNQLIVDDDDTYTFAKQESIGRFEAALASKPSGGEMPSVRK